jgi:hypothetical protein
MRFLPTIQPLIPPQWASLMDGRMSRYGNRCPLLPPILHNPVPCWADGLLGDAHDAADGMRIRGLSRDSLYFELHSKIKYASELKINVIYFVLRSTFVIFAL